MSDSHIVIYCTVPNQEVGMNIAEDLVAGRYAACVNVSPGITSVYRWKGDICRDNEHLLIIKSRETLFDKICERIRSMHPYEVPEIISFNISRGSDQYLKWISEI